MSALLQLQFPKPRPPFLPHLSFCIMLIPNRPNSVSPHSWILAHPLHFLPHPSRLKYSPPPCSYDSLGLHQPPIFQCLNSLLCVLDWTPRKQGKCFDFVKVREEPVMKGLGKLSKLEKRTFLVQPQQVKSLDVVTLTVLTRRRKLNELKTNDSYWTH